MKYNIYDTFKDNVGDPLKSKELYEEYKKFLIFLQKELNIPVPLMSSLGTPVAYCAGLDTWLMHEEDINFGWAWFSFQCDKQVDIKPFLMKFLADTYIGSL